MSVIETLLLCNCFSNVNYLMDENYTSTVQSISNFISRHDCRITSSSDNVIFIKLRLIHSFASNIYLTGYLHK